MARGHWRDSARSPRFFMLDAISAFPLVVFLLHMRWWTFFTALGITIFFAILEKFNFTVPVFFRFLRSFFAGPIRSSSSWWRE